jgi:cellulose synthase (UDP-forming)
VLLNACIGVLYERKQRRAAPRIPADLAATLHVDGGDHEEQAALACRIVDMSAGGVKLMIPGGAQAGPMQHKNAVLEVLVPSLGRVSRIAVAVRASFAAEDGALAVGAQFTDRSVAGLSDQVALVYGDSARWREFRASRNKRIGIRRSLLLVVSLGTVHAFHHYRVFFAGMREYAISPLRAAWREFQSSFFSRP